MKKILIVIIGLFLSVGCTKQNNELAVYNSYIDELKGVTNSSENIPFTINITVNKLDNNYISYTSIVDKNNITMNDIEAILIHDKETNSIFPSLGIFEPKISLNNESAEKGIKLTGYMEPLNHITFKFLIKYKNIDNIEEKYYYIYNYRQ